MKKLHFARILMIAAILLIVAFQGYWIGRIYSEEKSGLQKDANGIFRDVVYNLQVDRFKADTIFLKERNPNNLFVYSAVNAIRHKVADLKTDTLKAKLQASVSMQVDMPMRMITIKNGHQVPDSTSLKDLRKHPAYNLANDSSAPLRVLVNGIYDSIAKNAEGKQNRVFIRRGGIEGGLPAMIDSAALNKISKARGEKMVLRFGNPVTAKEASEIDAKLKGITPDKIRRIDVSGRNFRGRPQAGMITPEKSFIRMITSGKALDDTIAVVKIDSAYKKELTKAGIPLQFSIVKGKDDSLHRKDTLNNSMLKTNIAKVGIVHQYWYQAAFENPAPYLLKKISPQILFSIFLVLFTTIVFIFLFRNLAAQRRLAEMKNDFIGNITHELKTPLATVSVAVEALRNFGGMQSPERTKEYLDISAGELQRLSLLVDKVLKLSMFENQEITLQKDSFDLSQLVEEVMSSMRLQFEKQHAVTTLEVDGDNFMIDADRLHITSVVYNLLDNALKYSRKDAHIDVRVERKATSFQLSVKDDGIGIPSEYQKKIFDQFFRVPTGNRHNTKGYGLGLSYINHIVQQHNGTIDVVSNEGEGTEFIVTLPFVS